jgi:hypothetical protein
VCVCVRERERERERENKYHTNEVPAPPCKEMWHQHSAPNLFFLPHCIRQHTSAYVSIRQHENIVRQIVSFCPHFKVCITYSVKCPGTSESTYIFVQIPETCIFYCDKTCLLDGIRQHTSAYVSIRQHTSAYVSAPSVLHVSTRHAIWIFSLLHTAAQCRRSLLVLKYLTLRTKISCWH